MTRREREKIICRRVSARVKEVVPEGIGRWDPALEIVRDPSDAFLDALDAFLDSDTPETREELQHRADELVRAWKKAARRYRATLAPKEEVTA